MYTCIEKQFFYEILSEIENILTLMFYVDHNYTNLINYIVYTQDTILTVFCHLCFNFHFQMFCNLKMS